MILTGVAVGWNRVWMVGLLAGILSTPIGKAVEKRQYTALVEKENVRP